MTGDSMTTTQRIADIISGIFLAVVGIVVILATWDLQSAFGERLPPRTLPLALGSTTIISGALLAIRSYFYRGEDLQVQWPDGEGWLRLLVTFAALTVYLVLIEPLGAAVASLVFCAALIWYLDRKAIRSLCVGVVVAVVIQVVFVNILQLPLPTGFWSR
jgi:putative tricarboxylic transport membrane protein